MVNPNDIVAQNITKVYQSRSGFDPAEPHLYQPPPPARHTDIDPYNDKVVAELSRVRTEWTMWHSVAQRGEPKGPSDVARTARSVTKRFSEKIFLGRHAFTTLWWQNW